MNFRIISAALLLPSFAFSQISVITPASLAVTTGTESLTLQQALAGKATFGAPPLTVATRSTWGLGAGTLSSGADTLATFRFRRITTERCDNIRLLYGNVLGGTATQPSNPITIESVAIEVSGTIYPVTFNGSRSTTLVPGAFIQSDPQPTLCLAKGTDIYERVAVSVSGTGLKWPLTIRYTAATGAAEGIATGTNTVDSGTSFPSIGQMFGALSVTGRQLTSTPRTIAIVGDSIARGYNLTADAGPFLIAFSSTNTGADFGRNVPNMQLGYDGEKASDFSGIAGRKYRQLLLGSATHALCEYGINDLRGGASQATLQASLISIWSLLSSMGIRTWQTTITPNTISADSFATTGNQTVFSGIQNTARININNWLRDGAPMLSGTAVSAGSNAAGTLRIGAAGHPLAGYFEVADAVESARDSGLWKAPGYTTDGLHPTQIGAETMAAAVNPNSIW